MSLSSPSSQCRGSCRRMDLIEVDSDEKKEIRKLYQVDEITIKEDVERIKNWLEKQPHLPQNLTDDFIEKILMRNKFRVERTKEKLDNYYSLRGSHSDLIQNFENIVPSQQATTYLLLPKLTPNLERIIAINLTIADPDQFNLMQVIKHNLAMEELTIRYDYRVGLRYLFDLHGWTLKHILKINPIPVSKQINLIENAYSTRVLGIEIVNAPSFLDKFLGLLKLVLRPKIYDRIRIHKDIRSLHQIIPKHCLPVEYEGTLEAIPDLLQKWDKVVAEHKDFFLESYKNVSQEHLRLGGSKFNSCFGINGTFKQMQFD